MHMECGESLLHQCYVCPIGQCTLHARFPLTEGGGLISGSPLLGRTGGVVELVLGSVFIIELDTGLAGIYFHRYYTEYDVCHKQNT